MHKKNAELRREMEEIIEHAKGILEKERERKEIRKIQKKKLKEETEDIMHLKKILRDQGRKIESQKKEIQEKKYMMEKAYQYQLIIEKEDELFHLEKEASRLREEKEGLTRVRNDQEKIRQNRRQEKEQAQKRDKLADKLRGGLVDRIACLKSGFGFIDQLIDRGEAEWQKVQ